MRYIVFIIAGLTLMAFNSSKKINTVENFINPQLEIKNSGVESIPFQESNALKFDSLINDTKTQGKPLIIYFTGDQCVNCHKFNLSILKNSEIKSIITENFIAISLYIDDRTLLNENDWVKLEHGKTLKTIGDVNFKLQKEQLKTSTQPNFAIYNSDKEILSTANYQQYDINLFKTFLQNGLAKFKK